MEVPPRNQHQIKSRLRGHQKPGVHLLHDRNAAAVLHLRAIAVLPANGGRQATGQPDQIRKKQGRVHSG